MPYEDIQSFKVLSLLIISNIHLSSLDYKFFSQNKKIDYNSRGIYQQTTKVAEHESVAQIKKVQNQHKIYYCNILFLIFFTHF